MCAAKDIGGELVAVEHRELLAQQFAPEKPVDELGGFRLADARRAVKHQNNWLAAPIRCQGVERSQHPFSDCPLSNEMICEAAAELDQSVARDDRVGKGLNLRLEHPVELRMDELGRVVQDQVLRVDLSHQTNEGRDGVLMDTRVVTGHRDEAVWPRRRCFLLAALLPINSVPDAAPDFGSLVDRIEQIPSRSLAELLLKP